MVTADTGKTNQSRTTSRLNAAAKVFELGFEGKPVNDKFSPLMDSNSSNGIKRDSMRKGASTSHGDAPNPKNSAKKPEPVVQSYRSSPGFPNKLSNAVVGKKKNITSNRHSSDDRSRMSIIDMSPLPSPKSFSQEEKTSSIRVSKRKKAENGHANRVDDSIIAPVANPRQEPLLIDLDEPSVEIGINQSVIPPSWRIGGACD